MNQQLLDILNNSKYKHKFPPRDQAFQIKIREGVSPNSRGAVNVTKFYIESASAVLEDFAETILRNRKTANITSESEVCQVFLEAFNIVSTETRSCALGEFNDGSFERWILEECGSKFPPLLEHLKRKVRLMDLHQENTLSSVQITGGQIGNLIIGSVSQSELTATVAHIIEQGEAELGQAIQSLIGAIEKLDENYKSERELLLDLVKGFTQQIELPKKKRSPSAIQAIWDRIVQVSTVSGDLAQVVQTILPMIPAFLGR